MSERIQDGRRTAAALAVLDWMQNDRTLSHDPGDQLIHVRHVNAQPNRRTTSALRAPKAALETFLGDEQRTESEAHFRLTDASIGRLAAAHFDSGKRLRVELDGASGVRDNHARR